MSVGMVPFAGCREPWAAPTSGDSMSHPWGAVGTLPTYRGDIKVAWQRSAERYRLKVTLPDNMTARVYVPKCGVEGNSIRVDGQTVTAHAEGQYLYVKNIGSGRHTLVRLTP